MTVVPVDSPKKIAGFDLHLNPRAQRQMLHVVALADIADEDLARDQKSMYPPKAIELSSVSRKHDALV